ncbi:MAG TPA: hypothetical protein VLW50_20670 [Streptosporangiaceae bacterium]|nr:hypothetical protein [Streptosporangiaceae bacterium]
MAAYRAGSVRGRDGEPAWLPPRLIIEVLYGLQQRTRHGSTTRSASLAWVRDAARRGEVASLAELSEPSCHDDRHLPRALTPHRAADPRPADAGASPLSRHPRRRAGAAAHPPGEPARETIDQRRHHERPSPGLGRFAAAVAAG